MIMQTITVLVANFLVIFAMVDNDLPIKWAMVPLGISIVTSFIFYLGYEWGKIDK